jgi:AcrR family transcriptional regulator
MSDTEFDTALVTAAFRLAGEEGWRNVNVAKAARAAGLSVAEARGRFPSRATILLRFGRLADQAALLDAPDEGPVRDRLFDLLMRRFDVLQTHRAGVKALLRALPTDPPTALLLACATRRSMRWMLQGAGVTATGTRGTLQVKGLLAVWLWAVRAWERDESDDLSGTMAAVDTALQRAEQVASWLHGQRRVAPPPSAPAPGAGELDPAHPPAPDVPSSGGSTAWDPSSGSSASETPAAEGPTSASPPPANPPLANPPSGSLSAGSPSPATPSSGSPVSPPAGDRPAGDPPARPLPPEPAA